jgi:hypothetical protein
MREGSIAAPLSVSVPRCRADTALRLAAIPAGGNHRDDAILEKVRRGRVALNNVAS